MRKGVQETKQCHLVWMTRNGRPWFKIAAAAGFCEQAVRHACAMLEWKPETIVVLPDRVHILLTVPLAEDRNAISAKLQQVTSRLLADARVLRDHGGSPWAGTGWCAVLPSAVAASAVRRVLREKIAVYRGAERAPGGAG